jgi:hypothetical protein
MTIQERLRTWKAPNFIPVEGHPMLEAADRIDADETLMRNALEALEWEYGGEPCGGQAAINALRKRLEKQCQHNWFSFGASDVITCTLCGKQEVEA